MAYLSRFSAQGMLLCLRRSIDARKQCANHFYIIFEKVVYFYATFLLFSAWVKGVYASYHKCKGEIMYV